MADGKPFSAWLSGDLLKSAQTRADEAAGGNASKYVKGLIERDVATTPNTLLVELAKQYHPTPVADLEAALARALLTEGPVDGRKVIARFLAAYVAALGDPEFDPEQAFELLSAERRQAFESVSKDRISYLAQKVVEFQQNQKANPVTPDNGEAPKSVEIGARPKKKNGQRRAAVGQPKLTKHPTDHTA